MSQENILETLNACPFCHSIDYLPLYTKLVEYLGEPGEFAFQRCTHCALVFLSPRPKESEAKRYYPSDCYVPHNQAVALQSILPCEDIQNFLLAFRRNAIRLRLKFLDRLPIYRPPGRLLDVGCADGAYLCVMKRLGWNVCGVDPYIGKENISTEVRENVYRMNLFEAAFPSNSFDVVTASHVLEHLYEPQKVLKEIYRIMRSGGELFMAMPNGASLGAKLFGRDWRGLEAPRHLWIFITQSILGLLESSGFCRVRMISSARSGGFIFFDSFKLKLHCWDGGTEGVLEPLKCGDLRKAFVPLLCIALWGIEWVGTRLGFPCGEELFVHAYK